MLVLDNGDKVQGDASVAAVLDYTIHGVVTTTLTQLADGQLPDSQGDLYTAAAIVTVTAIIIVNTDSSARTVNLYLLPSAGTARRLIPVDMSLEAGYSLHFDGKNVVVTNTDGETIHAWPVDDTPVNGETDHPISSNWAYDHNAAKTGVHGAGANDLVNSSDAASDSAKGIVELATDAETTTGTDATRAVTPDGLAGSNYGKRIVIIALVAAGEALASGDGAFYFTIPQELNGFNLVAAHASVVTVSTSGTPTYQIHNLTQAADMLSTLITIDENENTSYTATAAPVIDTNNDDVATGDIIRIDKDVAGDAETDDCIILTFQLP